MKKPFRNRFPVTLLCFTIILAITVSGLTFPGFLLPLFGDVKSDVNDSSQTSQRDDDQSSSQKTDNTVDINCIVEGNSKAFSIEPVSGMTISAPENALDKDREFKVSEVSGEEYSSLSDTLNTKLSENASIAYAWEFDAGLVDDEMFPGNFKVELDLDKLDIASEDYNNTKIFRVDSSGKWYEYATSLNGSVLSFEGNQNSVLVAVIGWSLLTTSPLLLDGVQITATGGFYTDGGKCSTSVEIDGKKRVNVYWDSGEVGASFNQICSRVSRRLVKAAEERTRNELTSRWGEDRVSKLYDDSGNFKKNERAETKEHDRVLKEYIETLKKSDSEYKELESQVSQINNGKKELLGSEELYYVKQSVEACKSAIPFLTKNLGMNFPNYVVTMELSANVPADGVVNSPYLGHPYAIIKTTAPSLLMTITHEFSHISQRTYVLSSRSNLKFDEAMAGAVECEAFDYYVAQGLLTENDRKKILDSVLEYQHFAVSLDNYHYKSDPTEKYPEGVLEGDSQGSCYPVGNFLKYLKDNIKVKGSNVDYGHILKTYKTFLINGSIVKLYKAAFQLDDEGFTKAYRDFAVSKKNDFYNSRTQGGEGYVPSVTLKAEKHKVVLENKDYVTRLRKITVDSSGGKYKQYAVVLKKDDKFDENMPDYSFSPFVPDKEIKTSNLNGGYFMGVREFSDDENDNIWYVLETDGGTGKAGTKSGYTLYPVYAPSTPKAQLKGDRLTVTFPDAKVSSSYEAADGYVITLYSDKKQVGTVTAAKDKIGSDRVFECDLKNSGLKTDSLNDLSMTICEYFNAAENKGPESKAVVLKNSSAGTWKLVSEKSYAPENKKTTYYEWIYKAQGNNFYIAELPIIDKTRSARECKATFSAPKKTLEAGSTLQIEIKQTILQGEEGEDAYCDALYCVSDETIRLYEKGKVSTDPEQKHCFGGGMNENLFSCKIPSEKGTTGKLILIYKYGYKACGTVYTYQWTE